MRECTAWDSIKRDPELWYQNGDCFVHLYGKGQSYRGPAFKVPLDALLATKCHPLVARFMFRDASTTPGASVGQDPIRFLDHMHLNGRIDLYIPPPPTANKYEALRYHLAIRNFFAWVFRRPVVGEFLGTALIELLDIMAELRCPGENNMEALVSYLDEEGYLDMQSQPVHALAAVHFAEYFQFRGLYIDAFSHCVGMSDRLFVIPEYQVITSVTRKLIRQARMEMDMKLGHAGVMLRNFLKDDLSEAHIGLTPGGRDHLEQFRTFLLAFFSRRLGYYPPFSIDARSLIFDRETYCTMRDDFEALYGYLVDESFTVSKSIPVLAQGGICALQTVCGFDLRNKYPPLLHPLPLIPEIAPATPSRRITWLNKSDKLKPDQRLVFHAALLNATNKHKHDLLQNQLVSAYRSFEEDSIFSTSKYSRPEKLSPVDARKIRWILVYSIYQVLRSCTETPPECQDTNAIPYNVAINTANLPPWREGRRQSSTAKRANSLKQNKTPSPTSPVPITPTMPEPIRSASPSYEIEPDINYFSLTRQKDTSSSAKKKRMSAPPSIPPRVRRLNTTFRRSLHIFTLNNGSTGNELPSVTNFCLTYHDSLTRGDGKNAGTTDEPSASPGTAKIGGDAQEADDDLGGSVETLKPQPLAVRSPSTSSTSSTASAASRLSDASTASMASTVSTAPSTAVCSIAPPWTTREPSRSAEKIDQLAPPDLSRPTSDRSSETASGSGTSSTVEDGSPPALPRRNSRRRLGELQPDPLNVRKVEGVYPTAVVVSVRTISHAIGDRQRDGGSTRISRADDVWSQFADVGGLKDMSMTS